MNEMRQSPNVGSQILAYRGDVLKITLEIQDAMEGEAWLRTNVGAAAKRRQEIIDHVEANHPILHADWHDIRMRLEKGRIYSIGLPLLETGRFEAKSFFLPAGETEPVWLSGDNMVIKVQPSESASANTVYTSFVRQFDFNSEAHSARHGDAGSVERLKQLGYSVIPRSGTFRNLVRHLDFITRRLGFRIIQLLPIHPTPTTYARMGTFGSPFASLDFMDVDPALAEFDRKTTPLDQFRELVDAVHQQGARLFIDIPVNHTGWASKLQADHPDWFARKRDSTFESPGAWGVVWQDLSRLDHSKKELWKYIASVFLFWCRRGVDGFRCDAGYMIPCEVWEYVVARVREEFPETIFLLEGLGGHPETVERLLGQAGLDWAYSELFQNHDRRQVESCLRECTRLSESRGIMLHFAETHDNNRLAARSETYARMRTALSALCSNTGAFGITNGVEWFATEKIDVHEAGSLNWGNERNQVDFISRLNAIIAWHPAFAARAGIRILQGSETVLGLVRTSFNGSRELLILVNLDDKAEGEIRWREDEFRSGEVHLVDLITGNERIPGWEAGTLTCRLLPGEALCLSRNPEDLQAVTGFETERPSAPPQSRRQCLQAKALEIFLHLNPETVLLSLDPHALGAELERDPLAYCAYCSSVPEASSTKRIHATPVPAVTWLFPRDLRRTVMIPDGWLLLVRCEHPFSVDLICGDLVKKRETALQCGDGSYFTLLLTSPGATDFQTCSLAMSVYEPGGCRHTDSTIISLPSWSGAQVHMSLPAEQALARNCMALCTNQRGAMSQAYAAWGEIRSQYDALLAANLDPTSPVDRRIVLTRCRAWLVYRGYSQPIDKTCLIGFSVQPDNSATWRFLVPAGQGYTVPMTVTLTLVHDRNAVFIEFQRGHALEAGSNISGTLPVKLIVRPDIEDRTNHEKTKAYAGPENAWPAAISASEDGFSFSPSGLHRLHASMSGAVFTPESEWTYMVHHPIEEERGLGDSSDLFSPGYFSTWLKGDESAVLRGFLQTESETTPPTRPAKPHDVVDTLPLDKAAMNAIRQFVVKRDTLKTVIAGYPWFLDWGRDTLICLRGMTAAGMIGDSAAILTQFARFESDGTLPNMLRGKDHSDRDTSDAPLWFFVACADLIKAKRNTGFVETDCGGRSIKQVLLSIGKHYVNGTPNGIRMDPESALIFSPAHFTWMDTNYPAGTPRAGYPVEVQALWYAALSLLSKLEPESDWRELAKLARQSLMQHFVLKENGDNASVGLSDCLHTARFEPASRAVADDALRPNQLLAVTLGAVEDSRTRSHITRCCSELLVPGAIRSLADRPVHFKLPVYHRDRLLNNPGRPYWGTYSGDEDTRRKPAYHNGTAWTWLFPSYAEALYRTYGDKALNPALSLLTSSSLLANSGCLGQIPEIVDGDAPHTPRGCWAQAWGATELYRVSSLLLKK
jgi:predicted glycogen debranching enzyme